MIYTVTLNPAIDYYLEMNEFIEGNLNSLEKGYTLPGGKGINVSKVLKNFGIDSTALGFIGGFTGEYIKKSVSNYKIKEKFTKIKENSRINIKIKTNKHESEIAGIPPKISKEEYTNFLEKIKLVKENDVLILSGSIPDSLSKDIYKEIINILPKKVKVILDTRGEALKIGSYNKIFLLKPNIHELEEFFNEKYTCEEELIDAGKRLKKLGPENIIISLGKDGSIFISDYGIYKGNVPDGKLISSVGAGDSMVAGFIYGMNLRNDSLEAYKYAIASGSATAFSKGLADLNTLNQLIENVDTNKI